MHFRVLRALWQQIAVQLLTFTTNSCSEYRKVLSFPNYNQQDATFLHLFISIDALHVSGGSSAHLQEHITVHAASGIVNQYYF